MCGADLDTLASLLDKSLLRRRTDADGEERFWMLETIREFALERLDASGEEDALRDAQCHRLIELADRAGTRAIVDFGPWNFDLVAPEIDNMRAVLDWALERDPSRGLGLAASLETFWVVRDAGGGRRLARAPARARAGRRPRAPCAGVACARRRAPTSSVSRQVAEPGIGRASGCSSASGEELDAPTCGSGSRRTW